ncbi:MAG: tetratricopeptide repeat protein, partial [Candidatus Thermoplasmatota archaeon]
MLILDEGGVLAVEVFDSAESWRAVSRAVLRRYAHVLGPSPKSPLKATVDREAAMGLAKDFLNEIARAEVRQMTPHTWRLSHPLGEYTAVEGHVIHLVAFRPEDQGKRESTRGMASPAEFHRSAPIAAGSDGARKTRHPPTGREGTLWLGPQALGPEEAGEGEVAATERGAFDPAEDAEPPPPGPRVRRRKVLTSGWDPGTFQALEHYSKKEFRGDRSAALRFLVRNGLTRHGYMGPRSPREASSFAVPSLGGLESPAPAIEVGRARMETRIEDLERIAQTTGYAEWLRERARHELERMASAIEDGLLRAAARAALDRLPPPPRPVEIPEAAEIEASPATRRGEVPGLLRRAFAASTSGNYPQALTLFDEVLEIEASNVAALLGKAVALRRSRKPREALAGLDLVLRIQPNNAAALLNRGRILQERGDLQGALETFNRLVAI